MSLVANTPPGVSISVHEVSRRLLGKLLIKTWILFQGRVWAGKVLENQDLTFILSWAHGHLQEAQGTELRSSSSSCGISTAGEQSEQRGGRQS